MVNPSPDSISLVTVSVIADGRTVPIAQLNPREVAPRARLVVPIHELAGLGDGRSYALLVEATQPVAVTRTLSTSGATALSSAPAIPIAPTPLDPSAF